MKAHIGLVDIAAEAREMYGEDADKIAGRKLPEHEWRFEVTFPDGSRATMHYEASAAHVQAYVERWETEHPEEEK